jgi:hypothetical protein
MRTALNMPPLTRHPRQKKNPQLQSAQALRACEVAAGLVKCASDELAARWVTLARELSAGVPNTDLLRTRAWCNVLELRLKERASALELARQFLDGVWREVMPDTDHAAKVEGRMKNKEAAPETALSGPAAAGDNSSFFLFHSTFASQSLLRPRTK